MEILKDLHKCLPTCVARTRTFVLHSGGSNRAADLRAGMPVIH